LANCPTQELATEWAAKKPAVITMIPPIIVQSDGISVSATPARVISRPPPSA